MAKKLTADEIRLKIEKAQARIEALTEINDDGVAIDGAEPRMKAARRLEARWPERWGEGRPILVGHFSERHRPVLRSSS